MRTAAIIFFVLFSLFYGALASAIVYHLKQYLIPDHSFPRLITGVFIFLSLLFWLFALYFLLKIPF